MHKIVFPRCFQLKLPLLFIKTTTCISVSNSSTLAMKAASVSILAGWGSLLLWRGGGGNKHHREELKRLMNKHTFSLEISILLFPLKMKKIKESTKPILLFLQSQLNQLLQHQLVHHPNLLQQNTLQQFNRGSEALCGFFQGGNRAKTTNARLGADHTTRTHQSKKASWGSSATISLVSHLCSFRKQIRFINSTSQHSTPYLPHHRYQVRLHTVTLQEARWDQWVTMADL